MFELDGDRVAAPTGTFIFAPPGVKRTAFGDSGAGSCRHSDNTCDDCPPTRAVGAGSGSGAAARSRPGERAQLIVIENVRSAVAPRESVTRTVNVNVPAVVGVPVIRPGLSVSSSPGGSSPSTSVHV
jgi:hypothetical protein